MFGRYNYAYSPSGEESVNGLYGRYDHGFYFDSDEITVRVDQNGGLFRYYREISGHSGIEKTIMSDEPKIIVNPVEPLNLPEEVTNYLELHFDPIFIEPAGKKEVFLTFPVEIGVFLSAKQDIEILDIFSLEKPKYSLYGSTSDGLITRWAKSDVYYSIPELDPLKKGIFKLLIENTTRQWISMSRAVFEGTGMKIWYNDIVSMQAKIRLLSPRLAEIEFIDSPLIPGMHKSIELYTARELHVVKRNFLMEEGLV